MNAKELAVVDFVCELFDMLRMDEHLWPKLARAIGKLSDAGAGEQSKEIARRIELITLGPDAEKILADAAKKHSPDVVNKWMEDQKRAGN